MSADDYCVAAEEGAWDSVNSRIPWRLRL